MANIDFWGYDDQFIENKYQYRLFSHSFVVSGIRRVEEMSFAERFSLPSVLIKTTFNIKETEINTMTQYNIAFIQNLREKFELNSNVRPMLLRVVIEAQITKMARRNHAFRSEISVDKMLVTSHGGSFLTIAPVEELCCTILNILTSGGDHGFSCIDNLINIESHNAGVECVLLYDFYSFLYVPC